MAGVTVYTFTEFGSSTSHGRSGMTDEQAAEYMEAEIASAEQRLGRTRKPYSDEHVGNGFQVGTGDDPSYLLILQDQF